MVYLVNYKKPNTMQIYEKPIMIREPFRQDIVKYTGDATSTPIKFGFITYG